MSDGYKDKLIIKFLRTIKSAGVSVEDRLDYWEDYKIYEASTETLVIIACPSHHYGILDYSDVESEIESTWKNYSLKRSLKMKATKAGRLYFDGGIYNLGYLIDAIPMLESDEFEIKKIKRGDCTTLCFKIDDKYCLAFGDLTRYCYEIKDDGVWFIDEDCEIENLGEGDEEITYTETGREFVKWKDNRAFREPKDRGKARKDFLYDKNFFFEEVEEFGGFMML